jgi:hypothetical protein
MHPCNCCAEKDSYRFTLIMHVVWQRNDTCSALQCETFLHSSTFKSKIFIFNTLSCLFEMLSTTCNLTSKYLQMGCAPSSIVTILRANSLNAHNNRINASHNLQSTARTDENVKLPPINKINSISVIPQSQQSHSKSGE